MVQKSRSPLLAISIVAMRVLFQTADLDARVWVTSRRRAGRWRPIWLYPFSMLVLPVAPATEKMISSKLETTVRQVLLPAGSF